MANTRNARSFPLAAWALVAAGVLFLITTLLGLAHVGGNVDAVLRFLGYVGLTVAFVVLFLWRSIDILLRVAFIVGAVGWALIALSFIANVGSGLVFVGGILALIGTLVAGIIVFVRNIFTRRSSVAFLVLAIIAAILLLPTVFRFSINSTLGIIIQILFAVMLIVAGFFMTRRR